MIERFEHLTSGITQIYKSIQKIKRCRMDSFGLKGTHVMSLYYLSVCPEGLTAADLCEKCNEDKAAVSRILSDLEKEGLIAYNHPKESKKYRAKAFLTSEGSIYAKKITNLIVHATIAGGQDITPQERDVFYRVLFRIAHNLGEVCAELENKSPKGSQVI